MNETIRTDFFFRVLKSAGRMNRYSSIDNDFASFDAFVVGRMNGTPCSGPSNKNNTNLKRASSGGCRSD